MIFWTSSSSSRRAILAAALASLCGCAHRASATKAGADAAPAAAVPAVRIAVFPAVNAAGVLAPMRDLGVAFTRALAAHGIAVVEGAPIDDFLARHRIRYTGGVDPATSALVARELDASAVLITNVVAFAREPMPRLAVEARLVSAGGDPQIRWTGGFSRIGDESPGLFDLGIVRDLDALAAGSFDGLAAALADFVRGSGPRTSACSPAGRFSPRIAYRSAVLDLGTPLTIAVLPFQNQTRRRNAGEVLSLEFVRQLRALPNVRVVEPGVVRDDLLRFRVVLQGGISLDVARVTLELVHADLALAGIVRSYDDATSWDNEPRVEFTILLLDRANNEVLWRSTSYSQGNDGVFFFDAGKVATAGDLACRMAQSAVRAMVERPPTPARKLAR